MAGAVSTTVGERAALSLDDLDISVGKRARLHRLLYGCGPGNGTLLLLPIDQGLEHGPRDFADNPESADPEFQLRLCVKGRYSGIVFQVGLAAKYMRAYAGQVPLILKLNGKTEIPSDAQALSPLAASVEDGVRLGADAVGYTLYVGSPAQDRDFVQFQGVRQQAERLGMPVLVWAYPRGEAVEKKGGRDSLYAVEYAARVAAELGTDLVKLNFPMSGYDKSKGTPPKPYDTLEPEPAEAIRRVVAAAGKTLVIISGGSMISDEDLLHKADLCMQAGATGLIFGRNIWQRRWEDALAVTARIHDVLKRHGRPLRRRGRAR